MNNQLAERKSNMDIPHRISGTEDYLDSRDMQERITYLNCKLLEDLTEEEIDELAELQRIRQNLVDDWGQDPWEYGYSFIRDEYFPDYAQEFAEEIGAIDNIQYWLTSHIDWEGVASDMQMDYWGIELFGNTYWTREP